MALVAFLASAWVIASFALSGDVSQATVPISIGPLLQDAAVSFSDIVLTIVAVLLAVMLYWVLRDRKLLTDALKEMFSGRRGKTATKSSRNLKRDILCFVLLIGFIAILRSFGLISPAPPQTGAQSTGGSSFFAIPGLNGQIFQSSLLAFYDFVARWAVQILFIGIAAISTFILGQALIQSRKLEPSRAEIDPTVTLRAKNALKDGAAFLERGEDYRTGILNCYRRLCEAFDASEGCTHTLLTARELRELFVGALHIDQAPISALTNLFEEARYSSHPITQSMRDGAVEALRKIESQLRLPPEIALATVQ